MYVCKLLAFNVCMWISTNALPALTAVTLMRYVVILWDLTHAHAKQDSQEIETPALVSRLSLI